MSIILLYYSRLFKFADDFKFIFKSLDIISQSARFTVAAMLLSDSANKGNFSRNRSLFILWWVCSICGSIGYQQHVDQRCAFVCHEEWRGFDSQPMGQISRHVVLLTSVEHKARLNRVVNTAGLIDCLNQLMHWVVKNKRTNVHRTVCSHD